MASDAIQQDVVNISEPANQVTSSSEISIKPTVWSDRIPIELVASIFAFVVEERKVWWRMESPLLLCVVCRKWRSIAISTPRLWRLLRPRFKSPLDNEYEFVLLQQWLDRVAAIPISLDLFHDVYRYKTSLADSRMKKMADFIATSILPRSNAVRIVTRNGHPFNLSPAFSTHIPYKLLKNLHLILNDNTLIDLQ